MLQHGQSAINMLQHRQSAINMLGDLLVPTSGDPLVPLGRAPVPHSEQSCSLRGIRWSPPQVIHWSPPGRAPAPHLECSCSLPAVRPPISDLHSSFTLALSPMLMCSWMTSLVLLKAPPLYPNMYTAAFSTLSTASSHLPPLTHPPIKRLCPKRKP